MWPSLSVPHVDCTPSSKQFFRICLLLLWEKPLTTFSHLCSFEMRFWCSLMVLRAAGWLAGLVLYLDQAENSRPVVAIWLLCSWGWKRPVWEGWLEQRRGRVPCSLLGLRVRGAGLLALGFEAQGTEIMGSLSAWWCSILTQLWWDGIGFRLRHVNTA